jgi:alpha-glucosidase
VKPAHSARSVAAQEKAPDSMLNFYRQVIAFRKQHRALVDGDIAFLKADEPVLAFRRSAPQGNVLCIFNLSPEPVKMTLRGAVDADAIAMAQGATLGQQGLTLAGSGYALLLEKAGSGRFGIEFNDRPAHMERPKTTVTGEVAG